jgi:hypothetical protein
MKFRFHRHLGTQFAPNLCSQNTTPSVSSPPLFQFCFYHSFNSVSTTSSVLFLPLLQFCFHHIFSSVSTTASVLSLPLLLFCFHYPFTSFSTTPSLSFPTRDTHTKRQATQHGCLPRLLGDGVKRIEIMYGEEKIYSTVSTRAAKAEQISLVPGQQDQRINQRRTPFICTL